MDVTVRRAAPSDLGGILSMMRDFADHVSLREQLVVTEKGLADAVFGDDAFVELSVAIINGEPAGYAIYYPHFSSFRGEHGLYLEDIFVNADHRGMGVGQEILKFVARQAAERGFCRIDFQVSSTNSPALRFYGLLGAEVNSDEFRVKISGTAFERLVR